MSLIRSVGLAEKIINIFWISAHLIIGNPRNTTKYANEAIHRTVNAWGGQLAAGGPQVDQQKHYFG